VTFCHSRKEGKLKGKSSLAILFIIAGIILLLVSIMADVLKIGEVQGFGYKQILGAIVGIILFIIGLLFSRKRQEPGAADTMNE
jgi:cytochrome c biogenesis protein CcdA